MTADGRLQVKTTAARTLDDLGQSPYDKFLNGRYTAGRCLRPFDNFYFQNRLPISYSIIQSRDGVQLDKG
jgi:hypothetical protein